MLIWLFFLGASVFSFFNVVVYRLPRHLSFVRGYSICPECHHRLYFYDLIPVFNYLLLKGKCRYCGHPFSYRDSLNELIGGLLALLCYFNYDMISGLIVFLFFGILDIISLIDLDTLEIYDIFHFIIILLSFISMPFFTIKAGERLIGLFSISLLFLLINLIRKNSFGGGDIKLVGVCGFFMGYKILALSCYVAIMLGGVYSVYLLFILRKPKDSYFPFAIFLSIGMFFGWFFFHNMVYYIMF